MVESGGAEDAAGEVEEVGVGVFVFGDFAALEGFEEGGVLLVGQVVGGDVVGLEADGVFEGLAPVGVGLSGNREHEVDVDFRDAGLAEDGDGFGGLFGGVFAAEGFEDVGEKDWMPRETRVTPSCRKRVALLVSKVAGLASRVTSSREGKSRRSWRVEKRDWRCRGESMLGVPPPR